MTKPERQHHTAFTQDDGTLQCMCGEPMAGTEEYRAHVLANRSLTELERAVVEKSCKLFSAEQLVKAPLSNFTATGIQIEIENARVLWMAAVWELLTARRKKD